MGWCLSACGLCSVGWRAPSLCLGCVGCGFWGVGVRGCHRDLALGCLGVRWWISFFLLLLTLWWFGGSVLGVLV